VGFWKAFRGFSGAAQAWFVAMLALGVVLLGLGLWGELYPPSWWPKWWKNLGYGLNILASFTSFLIGLPVALVVLETIKSNAVQKQQIESVERISKVAWSEFYEAVHDLCTEQRIEAVASTNDGSSLAEKVAAEHGLIIQRIVESRYAMKNANSNGLKITEEVEDLRSFLTSHAPELEQRMKALDDQFGLEYDVRRRWNYLLSLWQVLDTHIRLRRMEFDLDPMHRDFYIKILDDVNSVENPIFQFLSVHSGTSSKERRITSVLNLLSVMDALQQIQPGDLFRFLTDDEKFDDFIGTPGGVSDYASKASRASIFLLFFKQNVEMVGMSGFPEKRTRVHR
jgi:hypothetical protein